MLEKILEIASRITNPVTASVFAAALLGYALYLVVRSRNKPIAWLLAAGLIVIGIAPLIATTYLAARGIYRIEIAVLGKDNQPMKDEGVEVSSSSGGEKKRTDNGWEIEIPPQTKPAGGVVTVYAKDADAFLQGSAQLALKSDYFPSIAIHMTSAPSITIRGEVIDVKQRAVADADVTLTQCSQSTKSDAHGLFHFDSCVADRQMVTIRAKKGDLSGSETVPASDGVQIVLGRD